MSADSPTLSAERVLRWLDLSAAAYEAGKERLTELDSAIGDGDHGANMARGFAAVRQKIPDLLGKDVGFVFKTVATTLMGTVGGASGPLYGTLFLQAAQPARGKASVTAAELQAGLEAGLKGIVQLGKAAPGDKTLIDALAPAVEAFRPRNGEPLRAPVARALEAARAGAEGTIPLVARKGRASYLGERSAGHLDPGAASLVMLFEALLAAVSEEAAAAV
ncbi:MAG TPA: dihydroxyacetone kinase subunit DhaL [Candidatus Methylacidiphilales bacterium]